MADLVAHTIIGNHAISHLGKSLKIVQCTGRRLSIDHFLRYPTSDQRAHLIDQLIFCNKLSLLRKIPCSTKSMSTRHDCNLEKRICMRKQPADCCMSCLMVSNRLLLLRSDDLGLLLKTSDDTVNCIEEILLVNNLLILTSSCESRLVADICYIGS